MSYRIDYTAEIREEGRKLYVEHMRSLGHGGDDWNSLPSTTRQEWAARAAKAAQRNSGPSKNPEYNPGGQRAVTRKEYDRMTPTQQGFITYMQAEWNPAVPKRCRYKANSKQAREFDAGQQNAAIGGDYTEYRL